MGLLDHFVVKTLPLVPKPIVAKLSKPYIAGDALPAAVATTQRLNAAGFRVTLDVLGEFVTDFSQAEEAVASYKAVVAAIREHRLDANISIKPTSYKAVVAAIREHRLDANISIKPTSFGLLLDAARSEALITDLAETSAGSGIFMRLDMEDSPCTTMTIDIYNRLRQRHGQLVGVVLQAYMRRTLADIRAITSSGPSHFRICKGIYVEPEEVAFKGYDEVRRNYLASLAAMLDGGAFVGIATHDDYLVEEAVKLVRSRGLGPDRYEFQMLLGVRESLRDQIRRDGHNLRVYVPFGRDWYGYSVRRLKENPALAGTMFKAIFFNR